MDESRAPIRLSDVVVARDDRAHPKWLAQGPAHTRQMTGYHTSLGESEHVKHETTEQIAPGVEFSVWAGNGRREDGALITRKAPKTVKTESEEDERIKCATPIQKIKSGTTTRDIPYVGDEGKVFGLFVADGKSYVYEFGQKSTLATKQMILLNGGDTMCWIASRTSQIDVKINEHSSSMD